MSPTADRNLLFGILALQMEFISRDALIVAMNAWVLEKHRPLEEILVEQGALEPADRDALLVVVYRHIAKHGGSEQSLAAIGKAGDIVSDLEREVADPDVHASLGHVGAAHEGATIHTQHPGPDDPTVTLLRYRRGREHASGGLGIVYVAHDRELHRLVALKEIQEKHADDPASRGKFLLEAEITGGLEHPGIVPVYGLGQYADGRPFYAMRFIKGDRLRDSITRFHLDEKKPGRDPGERALALQKLLRRFLDVCNAVDYAHSRGILHRDLKPDNVMVGKYGETLVIDWGLAKATGRSVPGVEASLPETTLRPSSASGVGETLPGSAIGTPNYMPPEQAAGRLDLIGPASDVYSLGATLFALLTDRSPFPGKDVSDVLRRVERGEFPKPRSLSPWLDLALEAVCLKAMALRPDNRYPSPRALADDVERWLADEPVTAHREPFSRRARRWARKHRTAVTTTAATVLVASALIGTYATARAVAQRRVDAEVAKALELGEARLADARASESIDPTALAGAAESARRAEALLESGGGPSLRPRAAALLSALADAGRDRKTIRDLDEARLLIAAANKDGDFDREAVHGAYLTAFRAYGIDVASLPIEDATSRVRSSSIRAALVAALDDWADTAPANVPIERLAAIAAAADDPRNAPVRAMIARRDVAGLRALVGDEAARRDAGAGLRAVFRVLVRNDAGPSLSLLQQVRREHPSDFGYCLDLGVAFHDAKPPRLEEAIRCYSAAVALRPESPGLHNNLGLALHDKGELDAAIAELRGAIAIRPDHDFAHNNLGLSLAAKGDLDAAIEEHRRAIAIRPDYDNAHNNLGLALAAKGDLDAAIAEFRRAIAIRPDYADAHCNLGVALRMKGDLDAAIAELRRAIAIRSDYDNAHNNLGLALAAKGDLDAAIEEHRRAIAIRPDYAGAHTNIGVALHMKGDLDAAIEEHRRAIAIRPDLPEAHYNLGIALRAKGDLDAAIAEYRRAIIIRPDDASAHSNLGAALHAKGDLNAAIEEHRRAIAIRPDDALEHCRLGEVLIAQGRFAEALESNRRGHDLGSKRPGWRYPSAAWVEECERLVAIEARLPTILKGQAAAEDAGDRIALADVCYKKSLYAASARFYDEVFAADPALAETGKTPHRYDAACAAALAGAGKGKDDPKPDDAARAGLRARALGWLRDDLAAWGKILEGGNPKARPVVAQQLAHWKVDPDLAGIRDEPELAKLLEPERAALRALWADVEALRTKAEAKEGPKTRP